MIHIDVISAGNFCKKVHREKKHYKVAGLKLKKCDISTNVSIATSDGIKTLRKGHSFMLIHGERFSVHGSRLMTPKQRPFKGFGHHYSVNAVSPKG